MKGEEVSISCSGVVLALSFAEHLEAKGDVQGLLFGAVTKSSRSDVSDSGTTTVQRTAINVQTFEPFTFLDGAGTVDNAAVEAAAAAHPTQQLLGWFAFRANSPLRPSLRELHVHEQMETLPALQGRLGGLHPTLAIMTTSSCQNASTHSFDYRFLSRASSRSEMEALPLCITNLKHDSQAEYGSFAAASQPSRALGSLLPLLQPRWPRSNPSHKSSRVG
ncbi:hypothetical protein T484DRAFT_3298755 [Baffinella frigidus]|nr:hypothetical protein T484DRAFT_3298755 [Cryptophyta sp. CCMP2293]